MPSITFVDFETQIPANWLNDVNDHVYAELIGAAHGAAKISFTPAAGIVATNVQAALEELSGEIGNSTSGVSEITGGNGINASQTTGAVTLSIDTAYLDGALDFTYLQRGGRNEMRDDLCVYRDWNAATGLIDPEGRWAAGAWLGVNDTSSSGTYRRVAYWGVHTSPFADFRADRVAASATGQVILGYEESSSGDGVMVLGRMFQGTSDTGVGWSGFMAKDTGTDFRTRVHGLCRIQRANSSQDFLETAFQSAGQTNPSQYRHRLTADGNIEIDGSLSTSGADYAEMFEWSDGNGSNEDRAGLTVVLDGTTGMIRPSEAGDAADDIIGVVSTNPVVLGDEHPMQWQGRYMRDAYGRYLMEDYQEVTIRVTEDFAGAPVERQYSLPQDEVATAFAEQSPTFISQTTKQRRVENPAYDPEQEYVSRTKRPEWAAVGMMGKLRLRSGEITGPRWIKLRDVEAGIEEWLIR